MTFSQPRSNPSSSEVTSDTSTAWWRDAVIYQIYPRSFADANGDGVGDLAGISSKLDYLLDLGVDALWLSPIFPSPMADFGYDVADYCDIEPLFGSLADVDALLEGLHRRGMRLLLDWVPNHTSNEHPWFVEAAQGPTSPKRDWYVWRDPAPDGGPPNNWRAAFSDTPAWTLDPVSGQYYLHLFLAEQPDLNWANPDVEAAMHDTLRFWLDRGVDGFRADVVHLIGKGQDVPDLPDQMAGAPVRWIDHPDAHDYLRRIRLLLDSYPQEPMMVGEVYLLEPGQAASYLGTPEDGELHLTFDFRPLHTKWDSDALTKAIARAQGEFSDPLWPTWVLSNHDRPRHRTRYGSDQRARAAAVLSLTMRGTPFLYAGEELGLSDGVVPPERVVDPGGRDGCRAPIPWTSEPDGGWTNPWLPLPENAETNNAQQQVGEDDSMHALYKRLLRLRKELPVLRQGSMNLLDVPPGVLAYERTLDGQRVVVALNLTDKPVDCTALAGAELLLASDPARLDLAQPLGPDEAVVARSNP